MKRWLLYHIPKTGGTSISQHLQEGLGEEFMSVTLQERVGSFTPRQVKAAPRPGLERIRVFQGHGVGRFLLDLLPSAPFAEMVVLREPAARLISHYNFRTGSSAVNRDRTLSFQSFLALTPPDFMLRFLCTRLGHPVNSRSLDRVVHDLAGVYALTTSEVDVALLEVSRVLGVSEEAPRRNVSGRDFAVRLKPEPALMRHLRQLNPLDTMLFEAVREMAPASVTRLKELNREDT